MLIQLNGDSLVELLSDTPTAVDYWSVVGNNGHTYVKTIRAGSQCNTMHTHLNYTTHSTITP